MIADGRLLDAKTIIGLTLARERSAGAGGGRRRRSGGALVAVVRSSAATKPDVW